MTQTIHIAHFYRFLIILTIVCVLSENNHGCLQIWEILWNVESILIYSHTIPVNLYHIFRREKSHSHRAKVKPQKVESQMFSSYCSFFFSMTGISKISKEEIVIHKNVALKVPHSMWLWASFLKEWLQLPLPMMWNKRWSACQRRCSVPCRVKTNLTLPGFFHVNSK